MMDLIVSLALTFAVVFFTAWLISLRLRRSIERPKYQFQENVRNYDQSQATKENPR